MASEYGYAGKILKVDLSSGSMTDVPTSNYANKFIGGLGVATKICWDELPLQIGALDPENRLIFMTGPLGGLPGLAGSRWVICGKSPVTRGEQVSSTSVAGSWGAYLKFAGYDGIVIQGKSEKPVYLIIRDGVAELRDASALWGKDTIETGNIVKSELGSAVRVASIGPAGENLVSLATVQADEDANGSIGFGAVMGSKKLKAIAVSGSGKVTVANTERLEELRKYIRESLRGRPWQHRGYVGYPYSANRMTPSVCFGCIREFNCMRANYKADDGETGKFMCAAGAFYLPYAVSYYGDFNDIPFKATRLCDRYGLATHAWTPHSIMAIIGWLSKCYSEGILTDERTGMPISKIGSWEFIETLIKKIAYREGFGDILADGLERARAAVGGKAKELIPERAEYHTGHQTGFDPRLLITTGAIMATSAKPRICEIGEVGHNIDFYWERWVVGIKGMYMSSDLLRAIAKINWGSEIAADYSTYEGKAQAAKMIQDRYHAFDSLVLCSWAWPILENGGIVAGDHIGETPTLESRIYSAVTGNEVDQEELYKIGERIFNLERAVLVRDGRRGRQDDKLREMYYKVPLVAGHGPSKQHCWVPGKDGELLIKGGAVVDGEKFEKMMDEYYQLRGWDVVTGLQKTAKLEELGLEDVARDMKQRGLVG